MGEFLACADCLEEDRALLDRVRPIFDQMLAAGVSREIANETMTYMLEKMEDP